MKTSRVICFMLALILSVSAFVTTSFAEDVPNTAEIELLNELGIVKGYEDGELHPEYNITRMEYAALIIRCLGYDGDYPSVESVFTDVPKDSWGAAAVQFAYDLGIINGYGDGTFGPDDNIKEVDAVKIIVSALGRGLEAEASGGYPTGYLSIAQKLKLLEDYKGGDTLATRGFVATLIANALDVSIVEQNFTSNSFMENKGRTILAILGISKYKGILTAVNGTNIVSGENVLADEVVISGRTFKTDRVFVPEYAGEEVVAYVYKYGETDEKIIAMYLSGESNKNLTVQASDILPETNLLKFVYIEKNRKEEIDLPPDFSIVYNGTLLDRSIYITPDKIKPAGGYVKLIDMDDDKKYDTAYVKDYKTYVARTVTEDSIYDIYGNNVMFDTDEENSSIVVKKDNKIVSWEDIKAGNVLSVASNMNKTVAEIIICDEILNETAISTATRDGVICYRLESGEYKTTPEYNNARANAYREAMEIELGIKYKFRLNSFGEIAVVEEYVPGEGEDAVIVKGDEKYGFLLDAAPANNGMSEILELKVLTSNNRLEIFKITGDKNVRFGRMVDGYYREGKATPAEVYPVLKSMDGVVLRQIVKYVSGDDGILKELYLEDKNAGINSGTLSMDSGRRGHTFSNNLVLQKWYYNEDTVLFMLTGNGARDTDILCTTPGGYFGSRVSYNSELWDIDSDGFINCICLYPATGESVNKVDKVFVLDLLNDPVMLVTHVGEEANDEGVVYKIIEGYEDGIKVKRLMSDTLSQKAAIRPGMIIQYQTNESDLKYAYFADYDEVVVGYKEMFDCGEANLSPFVSYDHKDKEVSSARIFYSYSTVTKVDYPTMTVSLNGIKSTLHNGTMVLKYNSKTGNVEMVDTMQIVEGQKVFFRKRLDNLRDVIIIE